MKIYSGQARSGVMGIGRVFDGLQKHLPRFGVDFVDWMTDADVVHAHIGLYEDVPASIPLVVTSHGMLWEEDGWEGNTAAKINRQCLDAYLQADIVTAPSNFVANAIQRHTGVRPLVVQHGIDLDEWIPGESKNYVLWNKGRQDPANNPDIVSKLAQHAPEVKFMTTFGSKLRNVVVTGSMPHDEMKQHIQDAGVYLDTPKESGGPCFGVLEAMASGVPVLAWRIGGNAEVIHHKETGYLARPDDFADLLNGLYYCLQHRNVLGINARQAVAENYTWDHVIPGYIRAYELAMKAVHTPVDVSIVIPAYNLGQFVGDTIETALRQDYPSTEVIVVNDASTDNTAEVLAGFGQRIRVIDNPINLHVADARNLGIWHARGRYILPLDADDRLSKNAVSTLVAEMDKRINSVVAGKLVVCHESDREHYQESGWPNTNDPTLQFEGQNRMPYSSMFRKKDWLAVGGYRRRIRDGTEDADFWTRLFQYGHHPVILDEITLLYTHRDNSLGKNNGMGELLQWYPWQWNKLFPAGCKIYIPKVYSFNPPHISVIIPVGPGHEAFLQTCSDSVMMQTYPFWEMVVINDTGKRWFDDDGTPLTQYVTGVPATFIDKDTQDGPAQARNLGIQQAQAPLLVFLDVDDIAQPSMIGVLMAAHRDCGGWIYGDWWQSAQGKEKYAEAPDWDTQLFLSRQLAPITGLYERQHILNVGGFDTSAPGWEDWDLQLKLFANGICGTRVKYPLIRYHLDTGTVRENNLQDKEVILQFIKAKHQDIYQEMEGGKMACSSCGGKRTVTVKNNETSTNPYGDLQMVEMRYTGNQAGKRHYKLPGAKGHYIVNPRKTFDVLPEDVDLFLAMGTFEVVKSVPTSQQVVVEQVKPQTEKAPVVPEMFANTQIGTSLDVLGVDYTKFLTDAGIKTMEDLRVMTEAQLLAIKGIGPTRVEEIKEKVAEWLSKR